MNNYRYHLVTSIDDSFLTSMQCEKFNSSLSSIEKFFYTKDWMKSWLSLYAKNASVFFVYIIEKDEVIALIPLVKIDKYLLPRVKIKQLKFWGEGDFYSENPVKGIITKELKKDLYEYIKFIFFNLLSNHWDILDVNRIDFDGSFLSELSKVGVNIKTVNSRFENYNLSGEYILDNSEKDMGWLPSDGRRRVRKGRSQVKTNGFVFCKEENFTVSNFKELAELHSNRQKKLNADGRNRMVFFDDEVEKETIKSVLGNASKKNCLSIYSIKNNNKMLAMLIILSGKDSSYAYITSISDELYKTQISRYMWYEAVLDEIGDSKKVLHLGYGAHKQKKDYSNIVKPLCNGIIINSGVCSQIFCYFFIVFRKLKKFKKSFI